MRGPRLYLALLVLIGVSAAGAILIAALGDTNLGESIAAMAAIDALIGAGAAVAQNRSISRQDAAQQYVARANAPEIIDYNAHFSAFVRLDHPLAALDIEEWKKK